MLCHLEPFTLALAHVTLSKRGVDLNRMFHELSVRSATLLGTARAFIAALLVILVWAATGPLYHFSDTWQLVVNTGTTIVTFLMVFLIQNTQNRDSVAIQLKLDELIRAVKGARNRLMHLEDLSEDELQHLKQEFERLSKRGNGATHRTEPP